MTILHTLILGIVEGISEFLPISSTGHLILTSSILHIPQTDFAKSFEIFIQLGAICAVVVLFWRRLLVDIHTIKRIIVAFIPTAVLGLIFYKIIKRVLLGNEYIVVVSLLVGGLFLIGFEIWYQRHAHERENLGQLSYKHAFLIGLFQSIAMIPGVSRSAATILGGLYLGIPRATIVEFSFLLAVPTMLAATGLDIIKSGPGIFTGEIHILAIGFIVAFIVALFSIRWLLSFIKEHSFISFGVYRILIALVFFFFIIL